jgi:hypothetical protein
MLAAAVYFMIAKPIPLSLLIHTIDYAEKTGNDGWNDTHSNPVQIKNVRVEPAVNLKRSSQKVSSDAKHLVFVDRTHSTPYPEFKELSNVTWKGKEYELVAVKPFYDTGEQPHHYELELK